MELVGGYFLPVEEMPAGSLGARTGAVIRQLLQTSSCFTQQQQQQQQVYNPAELTHASSKLATDNSNRNRGVAVMHVKQSSNHLGLPTLQDTAEPLPQFSIWNASN
jgi:hypothetical protein